MDIKQYIIKSPKVVVKVNNKKHCINQETLYNLQYNLAKGNLPVDIKISLYNKHIRKWESIESNGQLPFLPLGFDVQDNLAINLLILQRK